MQQVTAQRIESEETARRTAEARRQADSEAQRAAIEKAEAESRLLEEASLREAAEGQAADAAQARSQAEQDLLAAEASRLQHAANAVAVVTEIPTRTEPPPARISAKTEPRRSPAIDWLVRHRLGIGMISALTLGIGIGLRLPAGSTSIEPAESRVTTERPKNPLPLADALDLRLDYTLPRTEGREVSDSVKQ